MSFRPMLRPGQGFKLFRILRRVGATTDTGRPHTNSKATQGEFFGMITQASPVEIEQHKQVGSPITHTITQRGTSPREKATDILDLVTHDGTVGRQFLVKGEPQDPGELGFFLVYKVEERADLK